MEPENLTVIGYVGDLLADIYAAENSAYLHFTVMLNSSGRGAQSGAEYSVQSTKVINNPHFPIDDTSATICLRKNRNDVIDIYQRVE